MHVVPILIHLLFVSWRLILVHIALMGLGLTQQVPLLSQLAARVVNIVLVVCLLQIALNVPLVIMVIAASMPV
jgi:hypothetical protein